MSQELKVCGQANCPGHGSTPIGPGWPLAQDCLALAAWAYITDEEDLSVDERSEFNLVEPERELILVGPSRVPVEVVLPAGDYTLWVTGGVAVCEMSLYT